MAEIQKQNSGLRSNLKQFELQHLVSTETESYTVKNWCFIKKFLRIIDLTKCIMFLLIRLCGAQADLRLR